MVCITTTGNVQTDWFPDASVAVQVTIVVPRGKKAPDGGTQTTTGAGSAQSVARTEKLTVSPGGPIRESATITAAGHAIIGGVMSGP